MSKWLLSILIAAVVAAGPPPIPAGASLLCRCVVGDSVEESFHNSSSAACEAGCSSFPFSEKEELPLYRMASTLYTVSSSCSCSVGCLDCSSAWVQRFRARYSPGTRSLTVQMQYRCIDYFSQYGYTYFSSDSLLVLLPGSLAPGRVKSRACSFLLHSLDVPVLPLCLGVLLVVFLATVVSLGALAWKRRSMWAALRNRVGGPLSLLVGFGAVSVTIFVCLRL